LALLVATVLFAVPAFAQPVSITVTPDEIKSDVDVNNAFMVTITNNQGNADSFRITPYGPYIFWVTVPVWMIDLQSGETKTFVVTLFPTGDRYGRFPYTLTATSEKNPAIASTAEFYLDVEPVRIHDISLVKSGSTVSAEIIVDSLKRRDVSFAISLRTANGDVVAGSAFTSQIDGTQTVSGSIDMPANLLAGSYTFFVEATTEGTTIKKSQPFVLDPVHNIVKTRAEVDTALYKEITITLKNQGNVIEDNYKVVETTGAGQMVGFVTAPNDCASGSNGSTCSYVISGLVPGAAAQVVYRIEFWPTLMQYFGASVAIIAVLGFTFVHKTKPSVRKRSAALGDGRHSIILEIKNPFLHVVVRDFVHPIANVVHEEIESIKPVVRKTEAGTELIWKLGDMKPKETRLLKYGVKSVFQGGSISSPKAYIRFMNPKGKSFRIFSNSL
jgi:hypothetical protein